MYEVELLGFDVFDPVTMETQHRRGDDVPAWLLDTDYNGLCFHVSQAFFPRTRACENLTSCGHRCRGRSLGRRDCSMRHDPARVADISGQREASSL
jgi:hypothetical protein